MRHSTFYLAVVFILLSVCSASRCATITLDTNAKKASSDTASLEPERVKSSGEQIGVYIQNKGMDPQSTTIKITGLKDGRYDVYMNWGAFRIESSKALAKYTGRPDDTSAIEPGYLIRDKAAMDLAAGIDVQIPGSVVAASLMRCITSAQPALKSIYKSIGASMAGDIGRARFTLGAADDWVSSAISTEKTYRSVQLFVVPAGVSPKEMDWSLRLTAKGTIKAAADACSNLQEARARMYSALTDAMLKEMVVEALTPVQIQAKYYLQNQIPYAKIEITNNCDLSISCSINLDIPKGWKIQPKQLSFSGLSSGKMHTEMVRLIPPVKGQAPPPSLSTAVSIKVADTAGSAKLQIRRRLTLE